MSKIFITRADGSEVVVEGQPGDSVMTAAVRQGISDIIGQCGGTLSCATCHVFLADDQLGLYGSVSELEDEMLECTSTEREPSSRLSCQVTLIDGVDVTITLPADQL